MTILMFDVKIIAEKRVSFWLVHIMETHANVEIFIQQEIKLMMFDVIQGAGPGPLAEHLRRAVEEVMLIPLVWWETLM